MKEHQCYSVTVHKRRELLLAMMKELAGDAHISFEGNLQGFGILNFPGATFEETNILKRNTIWPRQDFVVVPLEPLHVEVILNAIGGTPNRKILHIQIEKDGRLEFSAYDNFGLDLAATGGFVRPESLDALIASGVLKSYKAYPSPR
jgi:hypothetical protein